MKSPKFHRYLTMNYRTHLAALISVISIFHPNIASADDSTKVVAKVYSMYSCTLRPFNRGYVDVAIKEKRARQKVHKRCEATEGNMNIFCKEDKAECTPVKVKIRED